MCSSSERAWRSISAFLGFGGLRRGDADARGMDVARFARRTLGVPEQVVGAGGQRQRAALAGERERLARRARRLRALDNIVDTGRPRETGELGGLYRARARAP